MPNEKECKGWEEKRGRFKVGVEMWRPHCCGRKEALLIVSRGKHSLKCAVPFLYEECIGCVPFDCRTLQPCTGPCCRRDVSNRHTGICFLVCYVVWLLEVIVYSVSTPYTLSRCLSPCHLTRLPSSHSVYFYECLQYLMEAKKAQQSLESTYKQLDSVSPNLE